MRDRRLFVNILHISFKTLGIWNASRVVANAEVRLPSLITWGPGKSLFRPKTAAVSYFQRLLSSHLSRKPHWYSVCAIIRNEKTSNGNPVGDRLAHCLKVVEIGNLKRTNFRIFSSDVPAEIINWREFEKHPFCCGKSKTVVFLSHSKWHFRKKSSNRTHAAKPQSLLLLHNRSFSWLDSSNLSWTKVERLHKQKKVYLNYSSFENWL